MKLILRDTTLVKYLAYMFVYCLYPINAVIALYFLSKGLSYADIGIVFGVFSLTGFLFEIPTGYVADKYGRRISTIIGLVIMAFTSYIWTLLSTTLGFALFAAVWMLGITFISGSLDAYVYDHVKKIGKETIYDTLLSTAGSVGYFAAALGSIIGTLLFAINVNYPYYLLSCIFIVSSLIVWSMNKEERIHQTIVKQELKVYSGLSYILKSKPLVLVTGFLAFLFGFYDYFIHSVDKPYILNLQVFDVRWLGVFIALTYIVKSMLASQFDRMKTKMGEFGVLTLCWLLFAGSLFAMASFYGILGLIAVVGLYATEPFRDIIMNSFSQKHIPSHMRATTLSSMKVYQSFVASILGVFMGVIFDVFPMRLGMLIACGYAVLVFMVTFGYRKMFKVQI